MSINVNYEELEAKYNILEKERTTINNQFQDFLKSIAAMEECWTGNTGQKAYGTLSSHRKTFESIDTKLKENNDFLLAAAKLYREQDEKTKSAIDNNN